MDINSFSLEGGSAGERIASWVGGGAYNLPKAGTFVMYYTGLNGVTENEPPTYTNCGLDDWIANYQVMKNRIIKIKKMGLMQ